MPTFNTIPFVPVYFHIKLFVLTYKLIFEFRYYVYHPIQDIDIFLVV